MQIEEFRSRLQIDASVAAGSRPAPALELFEAKVNSVSLFFLAIMF